MASLVHFEENVHRKKLQRVDTIPLLFPRLLCHILEYMSFLTEARLERRRLCRERFTLDKWNQLAGYSAPLVILLDEGGMGRGPMPFRFENMWLKDEGFKEVLRKWWKGGGGFRLAS